MFHIILDLSKGIVRPVVLGFATDSKASNIFVQASRSRRGPSSYASLAAVNNARAGAYAGSLRRGRQPGVDFITEIDINHVLGKLFGALAANRISARRAGTLAYIGCLLMQTQKGAIHEARNWDYELRAVNKLLDIKYPNVPNPPKKISPAATK